MNNVPAGTDFIPFFSTRLEVFRVFGNPSATRSVSVAPSLRKAPSVSHFFPGRGLEGPATTA